MESKLKFWICGQSQIRGTNRLVEQHGEILWMKDFGRGKEGEICMH